MSTAIIDRITTQVQSTEKTATVTLNGNNSLLPDVRRVIILKDVPLDQVIREGLQAAADSKRNGEPFVYRKVSSFGHASALVTVNPDGTSAVWTESNSAQLWFTILQPAEKRYFDPATGDEKYEYSRSFPTAIAATLFNAALYADGIPSVRVVATEPVILLNGNTISTPGYDPVNQVLITIPHAQRAAWGRYDVIATPTAADAQGALDFINTELLSDVPFASDADRAIVLAYFVTAATRHLYGTAPGFAFDAPERGSGKSLVASCGRIIGQGNSAYQAVGHRRGQDAEIEKQLGTLALAGGRHAHVDELPREEKLNSIKLSELLTATVMKTRLLGANADIAIEGLMLTICGNNIQVGLDFVRRILKARLHFTGSGTAARRTSFRHDNLQRWTAEHRPELLAAIHTIVRYGIQSRTRPNGRLGSYEDWSAIVLGSLTAVTVGDKPVADLLLDAQQAATESEDEMAGDWAEFLSFMHAEMPEGWNKTVDMFHAFRETKDDLKPELPDALELVGFMKPTGVARAWSRAMATVVDTPMGDGVDRFALRRKKVGNATFFRVEKLKP